MGVVQLVFSSSPILRGIKSKIFDALSYTIRLRPRLPGNILAGVVTILSVRLQNDFFQRVLTTSYINWNMIIRSWGVTSEIISADLSCTKTFTQNIPVFKLLVMRHSRWLLIFAWDFINSLCVGTELLWKRYHLQWLSYLYVRRHWKRKRKEMKRNLYVSQINFCHDLQPAYGGLSFEYR